MEAKQYLRPIITRKLSYSDKELLSGQFYNHIYVKPYNNIAKNYNTFSEPGQLMLLLCMTRLTHSQSVGIINQFCKTETFNAAYPYERNFVEFVLGKNCPTKSKKGLTSFSFSVFGLRQNCYCTAHYLVPYCCLVCQNVYSIYLSH